MNEELLNAWIRLSSVIKTDQFVSDMTYNEAVICNLLYRNLQRPDSLRLTATDLCRETGMLKSQMNRTLNDMEKRGLIARERSGKDKRRILISLNPSRIEKYERQHQKNLALVDRLLDQVGREKGQNILDLFTRIADTAQQMLA